jgi:hypothetical protein
VKGFSAMTKTSFADRGALMSPRTAKYVEAIIREGDKFDFYKWLKGVREEEGQARQVSTTSGSGQAAQSGNRPSTFDNPDAPLRAAPTSMGNLLPLPEPTRQSILKLRGNPKARLRRWLEKVSNAWGEFQASRARDAVYGYLEAMFAIVDHYKTRRRTNKLLRHAFEFADLSFDKNADPFTAVIRCTCGGVADNKTISKWARALRYSARCKEPGTQLKAFIKAAGGVNACATRYAELKRRRNRRSSKRSGGI